MTSSQPGVRSQKLGDDRLVSGIAFGLQPVPRRAAVVASQDVRRRSPSAHSACAIQICRAEMAEGRVKDRANEPAGTGSDKCPFGTRTPARLGPSQTASSLVEVRALPPAPQALFGLARRRCRKLCLGLPITVTIGHPKVGKSVLIGRQQLRTTTQSAGGRPSGVTPHCAARFARSQSRTNWAVSRERGCFLAQGVFSTQTHCLAFTVDRQ
jgi:hypothetical protein